MSVFVACLFCGCVVFLYMWLPGVVLGVCCCRCFVQVVVVCVVVVFVNVFVVVDVCLCVVVCLLFACVLHLRMCLLVLLCLRVVAARLTMFVICFNLVGVCCACCCCPFVFWMRVAFVLVIARVCYVLPFFVNLIWIVLICACVCGLIVVCFFVVCTCLALLF